MKESYKIEISSRTIVFAVFFVLLLNFLWLIRDVIFSLFIAFIIMSALKPYVSFLEKNKIPRFLAAFLVYIFFLTSFFSILFVIVPPLATESALLFRAFPSILDRIAPNAMSLLNLDSVFQYLPDIANRFFDIARSIFSNAVFFISTLFFGFYFLLEENVIRKIISRFFSEEKAKTALVIFDKAEKRLNAWFWGEITLMTLVGLMTFIGLNLIGIRYSLALAVLAGLLEAVPNLGPTISSVPAILLGFATSSVMGFAALALYFIVQQLENNLIVPVVMKKAVGLNPIITLVALLVGGKTGGVLGVLLAIPITVFLETILIEMVNAPKLGENPR
ncbi:AI-2E family transporter [Candidatus Roizmanbacteria bacterium]|nr:AI-2E family transporter [Candidatus Roizmanbacteria bacterium]